eukprot:1187534-Prorocentrum_minimum.AAC.1
MRVRVVCENDDWTKDYHVLADVPKLYTSVNKYGAWTKWHAREAFQKQHAIFTVVQGIGGSTPEWLLHEVLPVLQ